jgi:hypothetical protein
MTNTQFPKANSSPFVFTANVPNIAETPAMAAPKDAHPFVFADGITPVIVTYKNDRVVGKVSPHAMALASPVWKKFIFPPFPQRSMKDTAEPKGSNIVVKLVEELDFAEDPAEALLTLLNITHFRFTAIPTTLPLNILSEVAILSINMIAFIWSSLAFKPRYLPNPQLPCLTTIFVVELGLFHSSSGNM